MYSNVIIKHIVLNKLFIITWKGNRVFVIIASLMKGHTGISCLVSFVLRNKQFAKKKLNCMKGISLHNGFKKISSSKHLTPI